MPVVAVVALLVTPSLAIASGHGGQRVYEPPGKAGASQYAEVVPTSGGGTKPPASLLSASPASLDALGAGKRGAKKLSRLGGAGAAAAGWARATAPKTIVRRPTIGATAPVVVAHGVALNDGSAASGLLSLLTGSDAGGIGAFLPLLLGLSLAGALGFAVGRRRPEPRP